MEVRDVRGPEELRACQALQRRAWGIIEDGYVVPVATMAAVQKMGGLVLGAFADDERLVGFTFAFLGRMDGELVLYSQLAAVEPGHQGAGIGRRLKLEQRRRAREDGLGRVVWAFDPLRASNAAFNLGVLGAICRRYEVDLYGSRSDALNVGLATDRLLAEWSTREEPRPLMEAWPDAPDVVERDPPDLPRGVREPARLGCARVRIEVPADLTEVSLAGTAQVWQQHVRDAFQAAFAAGYVAVGFTRADSSRPRYLLHRRA
ncbi:MAG: GNAT family N-acetyltransferase [Chloroflexota bacterium]|nr:GNAT family N-acetyltransferase [Chloroflexota bacterium]